MRMRCPEDDVSGLGMCLHNLCQGVDHVLYAFVLRKQTKRQDDLLSLHSEQVLVVIGVNKGHIRNAVMNQNDLFL